MAKELYLLLGAVVRQIREDRGLSQRKLAEFARLSLRRLQAIESGQALVRRNTVKGLSSALGVDSHEIVDIRVTTWRWLPELEVGDAISKLVKAIDADMAGDHRSAVELAQNALRLVDPYRQREDYCAVMIKLLTFMDHEGQHERVIDLTRQLIQVTPVSGIGEGVARYREALALRRLERFDEAARIFESLHRSRACEVWVSALHQLGVIHLERAKRTAVGPTRSRLLDQALEAFERCIDIWRKCDGPHRMGFALTRLGQTLSLRGDHQAALSAFCEALYTFARHNCMRYVQMTLEDLFGYVFTPSAAANAAEPPASSDHATGQRSCGNGTTPGSRAPDARSSAGASQTGSSQGSGGARTRASREQKKASARRERQKTRRKKLREKKAATSGKRRDQQRGRASRRASKPKTKHASKLRRRREASPSALRRRRGKSR